MVVIFFLERNAWTVSSSSWGNIPDSAFMFRFYSTYVWKSFIRWYVMMNVLSYALMFIIYLYVLIHLRLFVVPTLIGTSFSLSSSSHWMSSYLWGAHFFRSISLIKPKLANNIGVILHDHDPSTFYVIAIHLDFYNVIGEICMCNLHCLR